MTINLSIPQQAIKITSTGNGPFSFTIGNGGAASGTGSITQNVIVSGIYKGMICNGTGVYVWNYNIRGGVSPNTNTANLIFVFTYSSVQGTVSCQGSGGTRTVSLNNTPVNTFDPQHIAIDLKQGASSDASFLGAGDIKIELTGTNSTSSCCASTSQGSIVQPAQNFSTSVPEFGSFSYVIMIIAMVSVMALSRKMKFGLIKN